MFAALWAGVELALRTLIRPSEKLAGVALAVAVLLAVWAGLAVAIIVQAASFGGDGRCPESGGLLLPDCHPGAC